MTRTRMSPADRKLALLQAALQLSLAGHYQRVSIRAVAAMADVSHPLVVHYFGSQYKMQSELLKYARKHGVDRILAQAIVANDLRVRGLPRAEKKRILGY